MQYAETITSEELQSIPYIEFAGKIVVVDSAQSMKVAEELLCGAKALGFDTETRPSFRKGVTYRTALLQLSTEETAFLFRLNRKKLSHEILKILADKNVTKIGAAIRDDIKGLQRSGGKFIPAGFVDLQNIVPRYGIKELSVRKMSAIVLGGKVSKAQRLSNWEARNLTEAQQMYAATDAWVCLEIYNKLMSAL